MKHRSLLIVLAVVGACTKPVPESTTATATATAPAPGVEPRSTGRPAARLGLFDKLLRIGLEQEGRAVQIEGHEASVRKGPFDILLTIHDPKRGVLMNVSLKPELYERARRGQELKDFFQPGTGMAEEAVLKKKELFISNLNSHHYLIHNPAKKTSRYHEVRQIEDGFLCRRSVEELFFVPNRKTVRIVDLGHDALHLVFFLGLPRNDRSVEQQREFVKIRFN